MPMRALIETSVLDVTVISTLQALTLSGAANTQGHALQVGEKGRWLLTMRLAVQWACPSFP